MVNCPLTISDDLLAHDGAEHQGSRRGGDPARVQRYGGRLRIPARRRQTRERLQSRRQIPDILGHRPLPVRRPDLDVHAEKARRQIRLRPVCRTDPAGGRWPFSRRWRRGAQGGSGPSARSARGRADGWRADLGSRLLPARTCWPDTHGGGALCRPLPGASGLGETDRSGAGHAPGLCGGAVPGRCGGKSRHLLSRRPLGLGQ